LNRWLFVRNPLQSTFIQLQIVNGQYRPASLDAEHLVILRMGDWLIWQVHLKSPEGAEAALQGI